MVEVQRGDFVGQFIGSTEEKTTNKIEEAKGKPSLCSRGLPINSKRLGNRQRAYCHKPADGGNGERESNDDFRWVPNRNEGVLEIKP